MEEKQEQSQETEIVPEVPTKPEQENKESKGKDMSTKITSLKTGISGDREELNKLDAEKEKWFEKKEGISKQIQELIKSVKSAKRKRNSLTDKVKEDKKVRAELNTEIKTKIEEIKKLHSDRDALANKKKISIDPGKLKREIAALDTKMETNVMPFDQEQKLMKLIKDKKKELDGSKDLIEVSEKISTLSKNIDQLKKKAELVHRTIQSNATESQKEHESMFEVSKKIDELRKEEEESYKKFMEYKKLFGVSNAKLKEKLGELNQIHSEMDTVRQAAKKEKKKQDKRKIESKKIEVQDKIKQGKKLTTEDLLVFQKTAGEEPEE